MTAEDAGRAVDDTPENDVRTLMELFDVAYWADPFPNQVLQMLDAGVRHGRRSPSVSAPAMGTASTTRIRCTFPSTYRCVSGCCRRTMRQQ